MSRARIQWVSLVPRLEAGLSGAYMYTANQGRSQVCCWGWARLDKFPQLTVITMEQRHQSCVAWDVMTCDLQVMTSVSAIRKLSQTGMSASCRWYDDDDVTLTSWFGVWRLLKDQLNFLFYHWYMCTTKVLLNHPSWFRYTRSRADKGEGGHCGRIGLKLTAAFTGWLVRTIRTIWL